MIVHVWENSPKKMIHLCEERTGGKITWVWWYLWERPNLTRWRTFKKHMIYWVFWISAYITRYAPLYPSHFQVSLNIHKKCLPSVETAPSSKTLSVYPHWVQRFLVGFLHPGRPVLIGIPTWPYFSIISKMPSIHVHQLSPTQWYAFDNVHVLKIHQILNRMQVPCSRGWINERIHCKVKGNCFVGFCLLVSGEWLEARIIPYRYRWTCSHPFN